MTGSLARAQRALDPAGATLRRAFPRGAGHLLLEVELADGRRVAGQWFGDPARAEQVAAGTRRACAGSAVSACSGIVLQPLGADRRLPALAQLVAAPGATLVAHRPERRGVVRRSAPDGAVTYTKVVRPERAARLAAAARGSAGTGVEVPGVTGVDLGRGTVTTLALPGRTLHDLMGDDDLPDDAVVAAARATGAALARLHAAPVPAGAAAHDAHAEVAVAEGWLRAAVDHGALPESAGLRLLQRAADLLGEGEPLAPRRLHRDLHDKQVLVDAASIGMLDFDLAAAGEPALDLANLLVHLELRAAQGHTSADRAGTCAGALVEGYAPSAALAARLEGYALATRVRLLAVYTFRPGSTAAAAELAGAAAEEVA